MAILRGGGAGGLSSLPLRRRRPVRQLGAASMGARIAICCAIVLVIYMAFIAAIASVRAPAAAARAAAGLDLEKRARTDAAAARARMAPATEAVADLRTVSRPAASRILVATHGLVGWFDVTGAGDASAREDGGLQVLHSGEGIYYGVVAASATPSGALESLWVVSRPHNVGANSNVATAKTNFLLRVAADATSAGEVPPGVPVASVFTHDAAGYGDDVLVADTARGDVLRYSLTDLNEASAAGRLGEDDAIKDRRAAMHLFTRRDHINTLLSGDKLALALLHAGGPSRAALFDKECAISASSGEGHRALLARVNSGRAGAGDSSTAHPCILKEWRTVGVQAHGLGLWRSADGNEWLVTCDSKNSAIGRTNLVTGERVELWRDPKGGFLKGMTVDGDVAYVGVNEKSPRESRDNPDQKVEIAKILLTEEPEALGGSPLQWRRPLDGRGMANNLQVPLLGAYADAQAARIDALGARVAK